MSYGRRKALGAAAALALIALAGAGTVYLDKSCAEKTRRTEERLGDQAREQAGEALQAQLNALDARAQQAASLPLLRAQVGAVDWNTLLDGFTSESWWESVRHEASVYGVAEGDALVGVHGVSGQFDAADLIRAARANRHAARVKVAGGMPYLLATAIIEKPGRHVPPVLLIGKPLGEAAVIAIAQRIQAAVAISNGKTVLASAGVPREKRHLEVVALAARDGAGHGALAQSVQIAPGLFLWTEPEAPAPQAGRGRLIALWSIAGLLAIIALAVGLRGSGQRVPGRAPSPGTSPATIAAGQDALSAAPGHSSKMPGVKPQRAGGTGRSDPRLASPGTMGSSDPRITDPGRKDQRAKSTKPAPRVAVENTEVEPPTPSTLNQFGRYTLLDRLGEGGMAEIYTAVAHGAEGFKRHFVVKRLRGEIAHRKDVVNMFIDEARLASSLVHSNIIPVFDFGKVGEEYFMAQEYILGRDLGRVARRTVELDGRGVDPSLVFYVIRETLNALEYAHTRTDEEGKPMGIVHRDISPANILVSARGEVKLFDFGIAMAENRLTQTQAGAVKGNVCYMAPEQACGVQVDSRTDVCSVGLTMYAALAGKPLYDGETQYERLLKAAGGPGEPEMAKIAELPKVLQEILIQAIQREPVHRFQSAAEFAAAISELGAQVGNAQAMHREMDRLFGADLRVELAKLQAGVRAASAAAAGQEGQSDTTSATVEFSQPPTGRLR